MNLCKRCGETDPTKFYGKSKGKCKKCISADNTQRYRNMSNEDRKQYCRKQRVWQHDNIFQYRWLSAKSRAAKAGLEFTITPQHVIDMWSAQQGLCYYSGIGMTTELIDGIDGPCTYTISIDRKDSARGYTPDNVVLCCSVVNVMKNNMPMDDFLSIVTSIHNTASKFP